MITQKKRSLQEHLAAIWVAIVIVAGIGVLINQSWMLSADILQGWAAISAQGDISYLANGNELVVRSQKAFNDAESLTFQIDYNHETVQPNVAAIATAFDYTSSVGTDGIIHVTVFIAWNVSAQMPLVTIPFSGSATDITISDAAMVFSGSSVDRLAITHW